jgi:hypothetical protein
MFVIVVKKFICRKGIDFCKLSINIDVIRRNYANKF